MDRRIEDTALGREVLAAIEDQEREEELAELRVHLVKGKWFLKGAEVLIRRHPIYYDATGAYWVWNTRAKCWQESDATDILNKCRSTLLLLGDTSVRHEKNLLSAIRQVGRGLSPEEPPLSYLQFGTSFVDINTGARIESTPAYFSTNPIPWNLGKTEHTPVMDELIMSWVGEEHLQTVYEIIAYCIYRDYPIHRIFCFVGSGANGKTRLLKIIEKFVGSKNKASVTLRKIGTNDFALYPLYRKLVCFIGETSHHRLDSTEIIKALSGQDPVSFEAKGRNAFTDTNYAKLIVGTNVLPPSTDTSRGWYRRWFVLKFPNEFSEGEDVLNRIPNEEYENLALKCVRLLPELLRRGGFSTEGTTEERQEKYIQNSNPVKEFLSMHFERDVNSEVRYAEIYLTYLSFLTQKKLRRINKKEFTQLLEDEGLETDSVSIRDNDGNPRKMYVINGLRKLPEQRILTAKNERVVPVVPVVQDFQLAPPLVKHKILSNNKSGTIGTTGTTNPSYIGDSNVVPIVPFPNKNDVLEAFSLIPEMSLENLIGLFPGEKSILGLIEELKKTGDLCEPKPGILKVVK